MKTNCTQACKYASLLFVSFDIKENANEHHSDEAAQHGGGNQGGVAGKKKQKRHKGEHPRGEMDGEPALNNKQPLKKKVLMQHCWQISQT